MKKTVLTFIGIAAMTAVAFGQNNLKHEILYTLGKNDTIVETKFTLNTKDVRYYAVFKDKTTQIEKLVLNDKTISTANEFMIENINLFEYNLPVYKTSKNDGFYCHISGKEYGPYEEAYIKRVDKGQRYDYKSGFYIQFKQMGLWFVKLPDDRIIGPFNVKWEDDIRELFYDDLTKSYIITLIVENRDRVSYFNGKEFYRQNHYNDNIEEVFTNKYGFCLVRTNATWKYYLNGNKIDESKSYLFEGGIAWLNNEENGIAYITNEGININGNLYEIEGAKDTLLSFCFNSKGQFVLAFLRDDKMFVNINGKITTSYDNPYHYIYGFDGGIGFSRIGFSKIEETFDMAMDWDGRFYDSNTDQQLSKSVYERPSINNKGDYIFAYILNGQCYVNMNGKIEGPYKRTWSPQLADNGNYAYWCKEKEKEFVVINGIKQGPYDVASEPILTQNGLFAYWYQNNGQRYFNINGKIEGFYDKYYSYSYGDEIIDPYYNQQNFGIDEKGNYAYVCDKNGKTIVVINGKEYDYMTTRRSPYHGGFYIENNSPLTYHYEIGNGDYTAIENNKIINEHESNSIKKEVTTLTSKDNKHILTCSSQYPYVMIDNKKFGNGLTLAATYNPILNSFRWIVLEGKELVVFEYKLDKDNAQ